MAPNYERYKPKPRTFVNDTDVIEAYNALLEVMSEYETGTRSTMMHVNLDDVELLKNRRTQFGHMLDTMRSKIEPSIRTPSHGEMPTTVISEINRQIKTITTEGNELWEDIQKYANRNGEAARQQTVMHGTELRDKEKYMRQQVRRDAHIKRNTPDKFDEIRNKSDGLFKSQEKQSALKDTRDDIIKEKRLQSDKRTKKPNNVAGTPHDPNKQYANLAALIASRKY